MPDFQAQVTVHVIDIYVEASARTEEDARPELLRKAADSLQVRPGQTLEAEITWLQRSDPT